MKKRNTTGAIVLLLILLLPMTLYFTFKSLTYPIYKSFPYEYRYTADGDSIPFSVPTFTLTTAENQVFTQDSMLGHISFVAFVSHPDSQETRLLTETLSRIYQNLTQNAGNIQFISIQTGDSLMQDVRALSDREKADPNRWIFAGGNQAEVLRMGSELGLRQFEDKSVGVAPFTAYEIAMVDKGGKVRKIHLAIDLGNLRKITEDLISLISLEYPEETRPI